MRKEGTGFADSAAFDSFSVFVCVTRICEKALFLLYCAKLLASAFTLRIHLRIILSPSVVIETKFWRGI